MKWVAAAVVMAVVGTGLIGIWHNGGQAAYAFAQTVEAMQGKRSFHIQTYRQQRRKDEYWAEFDEEGKLIRFRQEEDGGPKGPLITIWEEGVLNRYYPASNLHQMARLPNTGGGLEGLEEFDPETIVQEIHALVEAGDAIMKTDKLARHTKLMTLHVTHKKKSLRQTLVVNPETKFVVRVDNYWDRGEKVYHHGIEVLEYNESLDGKLFVPKFPKDRLVMDQISQEVGMAQGDMTEEEVALKVVRQALEAWARGDYAKAGKLFGGVPPRLFTERAHLRPARIISVERLDPLEDDSPPFWIACRYRSERDEPTKERILKLVVVDVDGQPGRWHVSPRFIRYTSRAGAR
jgi:hypothetical protein